MAQYGHSQELEVRHCHKTFMLLLEKLQSNFMLRFFKSPKHNLKDGANGKLYSKCPTQSLNLNSIRLLYGDFKGAVHEISPQMDRSGALV